MFNQGYKIIVRVIFYLTLITCNRLKDYSLFRHLEFGAINTGTNPMRLNRTQVKNIGNSQPICYLIICISLYILGISFRLLNLLIGCWAARPVDLQRMARTHTLPWCRLARICLVDNPHFCCCALNFWGRFKKVLSLIHSSKMFFHGLEMIY